MWRAGGYGGPVGRRQFEGGRQQSDLLHPGCIQNLSDLGAPDQAQRGIGLRTIGHGRHGGLAVGKTQQSLTQSGLQAQLAQHLHEVDAGGGLESIGHVNAISLAQRIGQLDRGLQGGRDLSLRNAQARVHLPYWPQAGFIDMADCGQLLDQALSQDHQITRLAGQQGVLHLADGAEGACDLQAGALTKARLQSADEPIGRAATEDVQFGVHRMLWPPPDRARARLGVDFSRA